MSGNPLLSIEEYLHTSYHRDCDFVDGEVLERNVGKRRHGYAQAHVGAWFIQRQPALPLVPFLWLRLRIGPNKVRTPDVVVAEIPIPDEEVFTSPPYLFTSPPYLCVRRSRRRRRTTTVDCSDRPVERDETRT